MSQLLTSTEFHFKEFSNLDASPHADYLMNSMEVMLSLESIQAIKKRAIEAMQLKNGDTVLEVGCGHGHDAEFIGEFVGDTGSVIAIDSSQRMINEAQKRSTHNQVKYIVDDITTLHFQDSLFSACHADRFLVSQKNYQDVFKKILRLIKPGGIVCFTDVDAMSIIISPYNNATENIIKQLQTGFVNPYMGRELLPLFVQNKLEDIVIIPETSMIRSWKIINEIFQFPHITQKVIKAEKLTQREGRKWENAMKKADQEGRFLYCINFFTVLGRVPF